MSQHVKGVNITKVPYVEYTFAEVCSHKMYARVFLWFFEVKDIGFLERAG